MPGSHETTKFQVGGVTQEFPIADGARVVLTFRPYYLCHIEVNHCKGTADGQKPTWDGNQGVSELQSLRAYFPAKMFDDSTDPSGGTTLRDLIPASTPETAKYHYERLESAHK